MVKALLLSLLLAMPVEGQAWKKALSVAAVGTLWVDFSQIAYGNRFGVETELFGAEMTTPLTAVVNSLELVGNLFAPKKVRPWVNAVTILGHLPFLLKWSKRPIGLLQMPTEERVLRVGWRLFP